MSKLSALPQAPFNPAFGCHNPIKYVIYALSDLKPDFKVTVFFEVERLDPDWSWDQLFNFEYAYLVHV